MGGRDTARVVLDLYACGLDLYHIRWLLLEDGVEQVLRIADVPFTVIGWLMGARLGWADGEIRSGAFV